MSNESNNTQQKVPMDSPHNTAPIPNESTKNNLPSASNETIDNPPVCQVPEEKGKTSDGDKLETISNVGQEVAAPMIPTQDAPLGSESTKNNDLGTSDKVDIGTMLDAEEQMPNDDDNSFNTAINSLSPGATSVELESMAPVVAGVEDVDEIVEPVIAGVQDTPQTKVNPNKNAGGSTIREYESDNVGMGKTILPQPPEGRSLVIPLGSTGITISKIYKKNVVNELAKVNQLNKQKGFHNVLLCYPQ